MIETLQDFFHKNCHITPFHQAESLARFLIEEAKEEFVSFSPKKQAPLSQIS